MSPRHPLGLYIHWPYCRALCPYCHFNRYLAVDVDLDAWKKAFTQELSYWAAQTPSHTAVSVFFGGGTPSLIDPDLVHHILACVAERWQVVPNMEVTLEMNPNEAFKTVNFGRAGINRISMGVQSFHKDALIHLGRTHTPADLERALGFLADSGLEYSFDLIYGHKCHEDLDLWNHDLKKAASWVKNHISTYQLSYEPGTPFYKKRHEHLDEERLLALETITRQTFEPMGLVRYEISNYARPGHESQHNLVYWRYHDYVGIGPGAHGRISGKNGKRAVHNCPLPDVWMDQVRKKGHGMGKVTELSRMDRLHEQALMGLRLKEGISLDGLLQEKEQWAPEFFERLDSCCKQGLVALEDGSIHASGDGRVIVPTVSGQNVLNSLLIYLFQEPLLVGLNE